MIKKLPSKFLSLCLLGLFLLSCEKNKEATEVSSVIETEEKEEEEGQTNPSSNFVMFTITTDDKYDLDGLTLLDYSNFNGSHPSELSEDFFRKAGDSVQFVLKEIRHPQIMEISNMAETKSSTKFLVSPGDTIQVDYRNGHFLFSGKNAAHYNFYEGLPGSDYAEKPYQGDLQQYKAEVEKVYNSRKAYFDSYIENNPKVSEAFKEQVGAELNYEYLYNLVAPRTVKAKNLERTYFNNMDGISAVLTDSRMGAENILNLESYFDGVVIKDFQQPELVNNDYFKRDLVDFIRHYFAQNEVPGYTKENLRRELDFIKENLQGELKTTSTGKLIWEYHRKGFGRGREDRKFFKEVIANYKDQFLKPSYKEEISLIEEELDLMNSNLPAAVRQDRLVNLQGDTLTVGEVLDRTSGKTRYFDFWATWCPPCVADFKGSKNFKKRLSSEENVQFIYISVEKDLEGWRKKSRLLKEYLASGEQYRLLNVDDSKILSFLKVRGTDGRIALPKYTVIDRNGEIISSNAPRLTDSVAVKKLLRNIE